jgi:hypothetical protein
MRVDDVAGNMWRPYSQAFTIACPVHSSTKRTPTPLWWGSTDHACHVIPRRAPRCETSFIAHPRTTLGTSSNALWTLV